MRTLRTIFIALLFISPLHAEGVNNVESLKWLESANPNDDAANAIKNGDLRLSTVGTISAA